MQTEVYLYTAKCISPPNLKIVAGAVSLKQRGQIWRKERQREREIDRQKEINKERNHTKTECLCSHTDITRKARLA